MNEDRTAQQIGQEIRMYVEVKKQITLLCGIEIGRRLVEAKEMLNHGEWLPWLKREAKISDTSASRYIQVFKSFGYLLEEADRKMDWLNLPVSKAYILIKIPPDEREEFLRETATDSISCREMEKKAREKYKEENAKESEESKPDLKPCPFCGGAGELVLSGRRIGDCIKGYIIARCKICHAAAKGYYYYGPDIDKWAYPIEDTIGGEEATKAWNMRVEK